jgi:hypothetical protein
MKLNSGRRSGRREIYQQSVVSQRNKPVPKQMLRQELAKMYETIRSSTNYKDASGYQKKVATVEHVEGDPAQQICKGTTGFYKRVVKPGADRDRMVSTGSGTSGRDPIHGEAHCVRSCPMAPVTPLTAELRNPCYAMGGGHPHGVA